MKPASGHGWPGPGARLPTHSPAASELASGQPRGSRQGPLNLPRWPEEEENVFGTQPPHCRPFIFFASLLAGSLGTRGHGGPRVHVGDTPVLSRTRGTGRALSRHSRWGKEDLAVLRAQEQSPLVSSSAEMPLGRKTLRTRHRTPPLPRPCEWAVCLVSRPRQCPGGGRL